MSITRDDINIALTMIRLQHTGHEQRIDKGAQSLLDGNYVAPDCDTMDMFNPDITP